MYISSVVINNRYYHHGLIVAIIVARIAHRNVQLYPLYRVILLLNRNLRHSVTLTTSKYTVRVHTYTVWSAYHIHPSYYFKHLNIRQTNFINLLNSERPI